MYAESMGVPTDAVCWWDVPGRLSSELNLEDREETEVTVVERDGGNE